MKETIKINNSSPLVAIVDVRGTIGREQTACEQGAQSLSTYDALDERLEQIRALSVEHIRVNIRSCGGSLGDALLIHDALVDSGATIETHCYGYVASAATVIAQAASVECRFVSSSSLYLIHNSSTALEGNSSQVRSQIELLEKSDRAVAELYAARSGRPIEGFVELMNADNGQGQWLSADEVVAYGLADSVEQMNPLLRLGRGLGRGVRNAISRLSQVKSSPWRTPSGDSGGASADGVSMAESARGAELQKREELRCEVNPSRVKPTEDPVIFADSSLSIADGSPRANRRAYADELSKFS